MREPIHLVEVAEEQLDCVAGGQGSAIDPNGGYSDIGSRIDPDGANAG